MRSPELTKLNDFAYKLPPTPRVGLVRPPSTALHRPALILLFAQKFFRPAFAGRMRWTGQIFWLLALPSSRLHSRSFSGIGPIWEVVSSYSSATAPDSHRISCA